MASAPVCVIGTGVAALALLQELRRRDADLPLMAIAKDAGHYAYRPNFSAAMAREWTPADLVTESAAKWSTRLGVELRPFTKVRHIDVDSRELHTSQGSLKYRDLVLATGSRTRIPSIECDTRAPLLVIDHLRGFKSAYPTLHQAAHVAVIGAGLVGCELADDLARSGRRVTVFDAAARPLARLVPAPLSARLMTALSREEVQWQLDARIERIRSAGSRYVICHGSDGEELVVDAIISAAGLTPNVALAEEIGLECHPGIAVDQGMATALPSIYAIGDAAQPLGEWRPFVAGAIQGARVAAARLTGDATVRFDPTPQPVVVKTRLFPIRLLPPAATVPGTWRVECDQPDAFSAYFIDAYDRIQGYALGGEMAKPRHRAPILGEPLASETLHA